LRSVRVLNKISKEKKKLLSSHDGILVLTATIDKKYWSGRFLTPWSKALLENLTVLQLAKKFPICHGIRNVITAFTNRAAKSLENVSLNLSMKIAIKLPDL
jgi:hypothetical protein